MRSPSNGLVKFTEWITAILQKSQLINPEIPALKGRHSFSPERRWRENYPNRMEETETEPFLTKSWINPESTQ